MEVIYTSDSSDNSEQKTIEISHRNLNAVEMDMRLSVQSKPNEQMEIETLLLNHNLMSTIPVSITRFTCLKVIDVSSNNLTSIPDIFSQCQSLVTFVAKNNKLTNASLPKEFLAGSTTIREINLSGNQLEHFPDQFLELATLRYLYLGGNRIATIPYAIRKMQR